MKFFLKFHKQAAKELYKLTKENKHLGAVVINDHLPIILFDPTKAGIRKKGDLSGILGYGFAFQGITYRILYENRDNVVRIVALGVHDVAYRKAKRRS